jgi:proline iminopeptidase
LFFPDAVAELEAALPRDLTEFKPKPLLELFTEGDDATVRRVARAWMRYAIKIGKLHASEEELERGWGDYDPRPGAKIDCHYASNGLFLEEGQLLRDAEKLKEVPVTIINGRYDMVCPPVMAWSLHQRLPQSKLVIVEAAGHSEEEEGTTRALLKAVAEFE